MVMGLESFVHRISPGLDPSELCRVVDKSGIAGPIMREDMEYRGERVHEGRQS